MSFLAGFFSQIPPSATGRYDPLAFEGVEMGASKDLLSWKPRLLRGPKGHFWKWFGIWSQSSSIRTMVKSCYFLPSDKRLSRSCQFCFRWGRLDWGRMWIGRKGRDDRMGIPEPQSCTAPQTEMTVWRWSCLTPCQEWDSQRDIEIRWGESLSDHPLRLERRLSFK